MSPCPSYLCHFSLWSVSVSRFPKALNPQALFHARLPRERGWKEGSRRQSERVRRVKHWQMGRRYYTKATRVCNTTLRTVRVWVCMRECVCTWTWVRVWVCVNGEILASLGACLGRTGQRYREKEDQEGAKRKLEVQPGLKSDWRLVSAKTAREGHQRNARNTKLMGSLTCAGPFM